MTVDEGSGRFEADLKAEFHLEVAFGSAHFSASGSGGMVLNAYAKFMEHLRRVPAAAADIAAAIDAPPEQAEREEASKTTATSTKMPLRKFVEAHPPKTNYDTATAIVTWAKRNEGQDGLTQEEIVGYWKKSGHKVPKNPGRDIRRAVDEGWLDAAKDENAKTDRYSVLEYGEKHVDEELGAKGAA